MFSVASANNMVMKAEFLEGRGIYEGIDSFYDETVDYSKFSGRVTDRDDTGNVLKISTENSNAKFFRIGDPVNFKVSNFERREACKANIRNVESGYFVIFVSDISPCFNEEYFRRGNVLLFEAPTLAQRVKDASLYRVVLLRRKRDFFKQLNDINHFVWTYDQQKVLVASEYDQKIIELNKKKQEALDSLITKKEDQLRLQRELMRRLDTLDSDLEHYRIGNEELHVDRWHLDHDAGHPVDYRPQELKLKN
jgi:hypothetical protein